MEYLVINNTCSHPHPQGDDEMLTTDGGFLPFERTSLAFQVAQPTSGRLDEGMIKV
jgi:hypothetical protein